MSTRDWASLSSACSAAEAGADSLYPVGRHDDDTYRRLAGELPLPINAIALPGEDDPARFG